MSYTLLTCITEVVIPNSLIWHHFAHLRISVTGTRSAMRNLHDVCDKVPFGKQNCSLGYLTCKGVCLPGNLQYCHEGFNRFYIAPVTLDSQPPATSYYK